MSYIKHLLYKKANLHTKQQFIPTITPSHQANQINEDALRLIRAEEARPASLMQAFFFVPRLSRIAQSSRYTIDRDVNTIF